MKSQRNYKLSLYKCLNGKRRSLRHYFEEIKKPGDERDTALAEEYLLTYKFYNEVAVSLCKDSRAVSQFKLLQILTYCSIVFMLLLVSSGVAQAAGLRVWSVIIHNDGGYWNVNYVPETKSPAETDAAASDIIPQGTIIPEEEANSQTSEFATTAEAFDFIGQSIKLPDEVGFSMEIDDIWVYKDSSVTECVVSYSDNNDSSMKCSVVIFSDSDWSITQLFDSSDDAENVERFERNGISIVLCSVEGEYSAKFEHSSMLYSITGTDEDDLLRFVDNLQ